MKYLFLTVICFVSPLFSMQLPQQDLQQKLVAARLHNRTHCPLAKLPKDVQDLIAQHLEFNDRESDQEFEKFTATCKKNNDYLVGIHMLTSGNHISEDDRNKYCGREICNKNIFGKTFHFRHCPPPKAEKIFIELFQQFFETRRTTDKFVNIVYSRDKSKVLMSRNYRSTNPVFSACYFFIYDRQTENVLYKESIIDEEHDFVIPIDISNDGKFFLFKRPDRHPISFLCNLHDPRGSRIIRLESTPAYFNKQSTGIINITNTIHSIRSEQEHQQRSKKTMALYLHQKGICKPFNYQQERA